MSATSKKEGEAIFINIYDMYTMNGYTSALGVGIYHSGVEVYGVEYGYGGHPFPFSGIFEMVPKDTEELGESFKFKESIEIGRTDFTKAEIEQIVALIGREFRGIDYHLINKNCNSFSSKFCQFLCGEDIPAWVNRLAYISTYVPFIERIIPREWISPIAIQHTIENYNDSENSNPTNGQNGQEFSASATSDPSASKSITTTFNGIWSSVLNAFERIEPNELLDKNNRTV
ncbi:desumoylating isopeptidase 2-like [Brachionus plicatilis]|uniref:Desumoylating isopeptidase 2-like n=1 Tax=Brachionus plicatilis TaxID=10195 RepID=A0A3M7SNB4_BRAPC|nr:desumoylating isopeptidase 2-like [Brachionus plicatilis]